MHGQLQIPFWIEPNILECVVMASMSSNFRLLKLAPFPLNVSSNFRIRSVLVSGNPSALRIAWM